MKKSLWGYNTNEVKIALNALREENESLNATIATLRVQLKNSMDNEGAKNKLFEDDLKEYKETVQLLNEEKQSLLLQLEEAIRLNQDLEAENANLNQNISDKELPIQDKSFHNKAIESIESLLDFQIKKAASLEEELTNTKLEFLDTIEQLSNIIEQLIETNEQLIRTNQNDINKQLIHSDASDDHKKVQLTNVNEQLIRYNEKLINMNSALKKAISKSKHLYDVLQQKNTVDPQMLNETRSSTLPYKAYIDMTKMRNEALEYMYDSMKDFQNILNENNEKLHNSIEQLQSEYNQLTHDYQSKISVFSTKLSDFESECGYVNSYNNNLEELSARMTQIMNNFIERTDELSLEKE